MLDLYPLIVPAFRLLPPEKAHQMVLRWLQNGWVTPQIWPEDSILSQPLWDKTLINPIGLAAGFDRQGSVINPLLELGFGAVEIGSITREKHDGSPGKREFRLLRARAMIQRAESPNAGMLDCAGRLIVRFAGATAPTQGLVGVNLTLLPNSQTPVADITAMIHRLAPVTDYITLNPTAAGRPTSLVDIAGWWPEIQAAQHQSAQLTGRHIPVLLKLPGDLGFTERQEIADIALSLTLDGLILGDGTISRPSGVQQRKGRIRGNLSGKPILSMSTEILRDISRLTRGKILLVGSGGIFTAADAYAKIRAGASFVQLYTALVFRGPTVVRTLKRELAALIRADGFANITEAIGADHRLDPEDPTAQGD